MLEFDGNTIYLTRGNYMEADIGITLITQDEHGQPVYTPYEPVEGDEIVFKIKRDLYIPSGGEFIDDKPLLSKAVPIDTMKLTLLNADTSKLAFGKYVYNLVLTHNDQPFTFIDDYIHITREV